MSERAYGVSGVCAGCGAVAWELLEGLSDYCMGCDSPSYRHPSEEDGEFENDGSDGTEP